MDFEKYMGDDFHPAPFFMTYPLPLYFAEERKMAREAEYLKSLYPADARKIQQIVESAMAILDYEESMIYDDYPDKIMLRKIMGTIYVQISDMQDADKKKDLVDILVIEDLIRKRDKHNRKNNKY